MRFLLDTASFCPPVIDLELAQSRQVLAEIGFRSWNLTGCDEGGKRRRRFLENVQMAKVSPFWKQFGASSRLNNRHCHSSPHWSSGGLSKDGSAKGSSCRLPMYTLSPGLKHNTTR